MPGPQFDVDDAVALVHAGESFRGTARELGVDLRSIQLQMQKRGIRSTAKPGPEPSFDVARAAELARKGMSLKQIGRTLGVTHTVVSRHLRRAGFEVPKGNTVKPAVRSAHPLLRRLIDLAGVRQFQGAAKRAGYSGESARRWRWNQATIKLAAFTDMAEALGYEIVIRKKGD